MTESLHFSRNADMVSGAIVQLQRAGSPRYVVVSYTEEQGVRARKLVDGVPVGPARRINIVGSYIVRQA